MSGNNSMKLAATGTLTPRDLMRQEHKANRERRDKELRQFISDNTVQSVFRKLVAFYTDRSSQGVNLKISTSGDSYTDGKNIVLGIPDFFFHPAYNREEWVVVLRALLTHEIQHINSSSFSDIEAIRNEYAKYLEGGPISKKLAEDIAQNMLNIMEDGRIENIIIHKYPGLVNSFLFLNNEIRNYNKIFGAPSTPAEEFSDFIGNVLSYVKTGRLAPGVSVYAETRFETEFKKVQPLLDLGIDAYSSSRCKELCLQVLKSISDYIQDLLKDQRDQASAQKECDQADTGDGQGGEYTTSSEKEYNNSPNGTSQEQRECEEKVKEKSGEAGGKKSGKAGKDAKSGKDGEGGGEENPTGKNMLRRPLTAEDRCSIENWTDDFSGDGAEAYDEQTLTSEQLEALRRGVRDELAEAAKPEKKERPDPGMKKIEEKYEGEYARTFLELFPIVPEGALPSEMEREGRKLEHKIERILKTKRTERRHLRAGTLCCRDLYRVGMSDNHVFMRKGQPMKADLAVFILLDNSGSMGANGATVQGPGGKRISFNKSSLSRTAAGIIERGLSRFAAIKVSLFDVSGGIIRHSTLKRFDEVSRSNKCYNSIRSVGIGGGNKDGYSIRVATNDLMKRHERMKVLVALSDGLPSDYNGGESQGIEDVNAAVREARQKGVLVVPIMFGPAEDRQNMKGQFTQMYSTFISSEPIDITKEFLRFFTKLIERA